MAAHHSVTIEKSPADHRDYRSVILPNKLQALVIHDPKTDKAAASLDVHIGSFSEPQDIPGLAHFLEHMLFLGTKKYPDENAYSSYLNEHGGGSNAYTDQENTNYHFEVLPEHLEGALDRFAQFFICPLFNEDATMREMQAVDSENSKNLQSDSWRLQQLARHAGNPAHPYSRFSVGSLQTLLETPKSRGQDIRKALLAFHAQYYSANVMKLVVLSNQSLDTLEGWVRALFSEVPNREVPLPKWSVPPYMAEQLAQCYHVVPVKDSRRLELLFPCPSWQELWRTKPDHYLSHLIGHEGPGSILSFLKNKKWAIGLTAGGGQEGSNFSLFRVEVELTPAGLTNVDEVVKSVFQYVAMVKQNIQEWIFTEVKTVDEMRFRFKDPEKPMNHVIMTAMNLHLFPTSHVLSGPALQTVWDKAAIEQVLACITPKNVLYGFRLFEQKVYMYPKTMAVVSRQFKNEANQVEPWYETKYRNAQLSAERVAAWNNVQPNSALYLPPPNIFIPENFELRDRPSQLPKYPSVVFASPTVKVWHKLDDTFLKPKANIYVKITSPTAYQSPRHAVLAKLFTKMLTESLNEYAYAADIAGLTYEISNSANGYELRMKGYNDKQQVLLQKIFDRFRTLVIDLEMFQAILESTKRDYSNFLMDQPYQHAIYNATVVQQNLRWHNDDYIAVCEEGVTGAELQQFVAQMSQHLHLELLVHGNLTSQEAQAIGVMVESTLKTKPLHESEFPQPRIIQLPVGITCVHRKPVPNADNKNSALGIVYQVGFENIYECALLELIVQLCADEAYNQLRTIEQLGYIVSMAIKEQNLIQALCILIQSSRKDPVALDQRAELFVSNMRKLIEGCPDNEWAKHLAAVAARKTEKPKSMNQESSRMWEEIESGRYAFDWQLQVAQAVLKVTKPELLAFYDKYIVAGAPKRAKLTAQVFGKNHPVPATQPLEGEIYITKLAEFKRSRPLFPCSQPPN